MSLDGMVFVLFVGHISSIDAEVLMNTMCDI